MATFIDEHERTCLPRLSTTKNQGETGLVSPCLDDRHALVLHLCLF